MVFFSLQDHSHIQEVIEEKLVAAWAAESLQMWRRNSQSLKTGESRLSFPNKSKDASCEKGKVGLKIQDETVRICPVSRICRILV